MLRDRPSGSGRLVLMPGDVSGGDFATTGDERRRCVDLLTRLHHEFDLVVVDLRAGRSYAVELALDATASPEMSAVPARWLVFHRWTRQHVAAAANLVFGRRGIVAAGVTRGHDEDALRGAVRFVRSAVPDPESPLWSQVSAAQWTWMRSCDEQLERLAHEQGLGCTRVLGSVPFEPVLQWREQLITDVDVLDSKVAGLETWQAMSDLAARLTETACWDEA